MEDSTSSTRSNSKPLDKWMISTMFVVIAAMRVIYSTIIAFLPHHIKLHHSTITATQIGLILS